MAFPEINSIGQPDSRFRDMVRFEDGRCRPMTIEDHHDTVAGLLLGPSVPEQVRVSFDRARSIFLYAWYDYELLVPAESQALASFEMALHLRLSAIGHDMNKATMRNLVEKARKCRILPPPIHGAHPVSDPYDAMIAIRNALAHGTTDVHTPAIAFAVLELCAQRIDALFP